MTCRDCGGLVTWRGPCAALTHTKCHSCGAVNSQAESAWPPDDDDESGEESDA